MSGLLTVAQLHLPLRAPRLSAPTVPFQNLHMSGPTDQVSESILGPNPPIELGTDGDSSQDKGLLPAKADGNIRRVSSPDEEFSRVHVLDLLGVITTLLGPSHCCRINVAQKRRYRGESCAVCFLSPHQNIVSSLQHRHCCLNIAHESASARST